MPGEGEGSEEAERGGGNERRLTATQSQHYWGGFGAGAWPVRAI